LYLFFNNFHSLFFGILFFNSFPFPLLMHLVFEDLVQFLLSCLFPYLSPSSYSIFLPPHFILTRTITPSVPRHYFTFQISQSSVNRITSIYLTSLG
jgi:hypothetical protein